METEIAKILAEKKSDLSPMSVKTYVNAIHKVLELIGSTSLNDLYLKNAEIVKTLKSKYEKPNTIKTKIASIIVLIRCIETPKNKKALDKALSEYGSEIERLTTDIKGNLVDGEKSEKMKSNWISGEDAAKIKSCLRDLVGEKTEVNSPKELMHLRNFVLFSLYQDIPSRNDLADAKLVFKPAKKEAELSDEYNYILLDKKAKKAVYQMNQYKTAKSYGQKNIAISDELYPLLARYKEQVDKFNGGQHWAFLSNNANEKITRNRLGVVYSHFGDCIGKKLSTTLNRHQAVSDLVPIEKMKALADKMGNSVAEQTEVYAKV
jgi:hypothetical protein